jgi:ABC-2 type transport system ATP-binding protein
MAGPDAVAIEPAIEVEDLVLVYPGPKRALDGISFAVERGEIFGFLGPNGSGKTTTVRILVTLLRRTSGVARVGGFDTERDRDRIHALIGYAGQTIGIDDDLTVHENLALQALLHAAAPTEIKAWADDLVDALSLGDLLGERAGRLSGGLRRRVDLAAALVHRPVILFLDEPTTGLDPQSRNALWAHLRRLSDAGMTIFLTTHSLEEADRACDRVAIIDAGGLVKVGTPAALKQEVGEGRLVLTLAAGASSAAAAAALRGDRHVARVEAGDPLVVYVRDVPGSVAPLLRRLDQHGVEVAAVEQEQASLDDVFLHYTGRAPRVEAPARRAVSGIFAAAHGGPRR